MNIKGRWFNFPPRDNGSNKPPNFIAGGDYLLQVESIEDKKSGTTHSSYYTIRCRVLHKEVHPDFRLTFALSHKEVALYRLAEFIYACTEESVLGTDYLFDPSKFIHRCFNAKLDIGTYENKQHNTLESFLDSNYEIIDFSPKGDDES